MKSIATWTFLLLWAISASPAKSDEQLAFGHFVYVKGQVNFIVNRKSQTPKRDTKFFRGTTISTGKKSFAIIRFRDSSTMKIDPDSNVTLKKLIARDDGKGYLGTTKIVLSVGGVMLDVVKRFAGPPTVEVEVPSVVTFGVRGTQTYIFTERGQEQAWSVVKEGRVGAFDFEGDDSESISKDSALVAFKRGKRLSSPQKYRWIRNIKWEMNPQKGSLDTGRKKGIESRQKELERKKAKIFKRTRKNFLEQRLKLDKRYKNRWKRPIKILQRYLNKINAGKPLTRDQYLWILKKPEVENWVNRLLAEKIRALNLKGKELADFKKHYKNELYKLAYQKFFKQSITGKILEILSIDEKDALNSRMERALFAWLRGHGDEEKLLFDALKNGQLTRQEVLDMLSRNQSLRGNLRRKAQVVDRPEKLVKDVCSGATASGFNCNAQKSPCNRNTHFVADVFTDGSGDTWYACVLKAY